MNEAQVGVPAASPQARRPRWIGIVLVLVLLGAGGLSLPFGLYHWRAWQADRALAAALAETDEIEPAGWRWHELQAQRQAIPDERNSAVRVVNAHATLPTNWIPNIGPAGANPQAAPVSLWTVVSDLPADVPLDDDVAQALAAALDKVPVALAQARSLSDLDEGRYTLIMTIDFVSMRMDDIQNARNVATLLRLDAARHIHEGRLDAALASCVAVVNTGRSMGDEPVGLVQLVRCACLGMALKSIERALAQGAGSEASLLRLQHLLERCAAEVPALILATMRGERACMHQCVEAVKSGQINGAGLLGGPPSATNRVEDLILAQRARAEHAAFLRLLNLQVEAAKLPIAEQAAQFERLKPRAREIGILPGLLLTGTDKLQSAQIRTLAQLRCGAAALAVERYRNKHGKWPETLAAAYDGDSVPQDPFSGGSLVYRRTATGVLIYSVGQDGQDNGGKSAKNSTLTGTDLVFQLWDVGKRQKEK